MKRLVVRAALALALLVLGAALMALLVANPLGWSALEPLGRLAGHGAATAVTDDQLWTCGMDPQVLQEGPGTCPICQMDLTPMISEPAPAPADPPWSCPRHGDVIAEEGPGECPICGRDLARQTGAAAQPAPEPGEEQTTWTCPMHPLVVQDQAGTCGSCGMDLIERSVAAPPRPGGVDTIVRGEGLAVTIDPTVVQNMNVRTTLAERGDIRRSLRTVGYFAFDQEQMVTVTTKFEGYVEEAYVSHVGQAVRRGQPLFEIYSRELVQTQQELLSALDYARRLEGADEHTRRRAFALVEAARQRLAYWDISDDQVRDVESDGTVRRTLTITAPAGGVIMRRPAGLEGMAVRPGMEILHVADLSQLWLRTEIYEDQLASVHVGQTARIDVNAFPELDLTGTVAFVDPEVSETTRTVQVTLTVSNPRQRLRVGMWATVSFEATLAEDAVVVPSQAILRTGERDVVVVALGEGRFAPRQVRLGPEAAGRTAISSGLDAGERIVTSGQFLIDSESNLREAVKAIMAARHEH